MEKCRKLEQVVENLRNFEMSSGDLNSVAVICFWFWTSIFVHFLFGLAMVWRRKHGFVVLECLCN